MLSYIRKGHKSHVVIILNFSPVVRENYRIGVPDAQYYTEIYNSDTENYWGSGVGNKGKMAVDSISSHGRENSIQITIPPLAGIILKPKV